MDGIRMENSEEDGRFGNGRKASGEAPGLYLSLASSCAETPSKIRIEME